MADYTKLIPFILKWEGGFANDPADAGGATMKGVTLATYRSVYGAGKTVKDLKNITKNEWNYIFKKKYWDKFKGDKINHQGVADMCVDWLWHSGSIAAKKVQTILGVSADGIVGDKTIAAINAQNGDELFDKIKDARIKFVTNLANNRAGNKKFLKGWLNRINGVPKA
jgi:lysozyme family protein